MNKAKENFGPKYLYAEDLLQGGRFKTFKLTVKEYHPENTLTRADNNKLIDKPAISFNGATKILVLAGCNQKFLKYAIGEAEIEKCVGREITLTVRLIDAFGEKVPAIRVAPGCDVRKGLKKHWGESANKETEGSSK